MMKVSIITCTYNSEKTILDTINSVLSQKYKNIEYLIIDGKSTDSTIDIIRLNQFNFSGRLRFISEPDNGIYDAMNKGILNSTGDIIGFLNSDDYFTSDDVIGSMIDNFEEGIDAVYGDVHFIKNGNKEKCVRYYSSAIFRPMMLKYGLMPAHPTFYARKNVYLKDGLFSLDYKIAADYDMMVRLFYKYNIKARYIKMDFVTMRVGGISTKNLYSRFLTTKEDLKACRNYGLKTNLFFISFKYLKKIFEIKPNII